MVPKRQEVVNKDLIRSSAGDAFTSFLMRVFPLNHRLTAAGELLAKRAGQTLARWLVLETVAGEPLTVAEIARRLGQARQGVQRHADLLVGEGLASYLENPRHRRANLMDITPDGVAALRQIQEGQRDWANRLGAEMGEEELDRVNSILDHALALVTRDLPMLQHPQDR
jgi:DNA-binding MarR family transcriptional regulator